MRIHPITRISVCARLAILLLITSSRASDFGERDRHATTSKLDGSLTRLLEGDEPKSTAPPKAATQHTDPPPEEGEKHKDPPPKDEKKEGSDGGGGGGDGDSAGGGDEDDGGSSGSVTAESSSTTSEQSSNSGGNGKKEPIGGDNIGGGSTEGGSSSSNGGHSSGSSSTTGHDENIGPKRKSSMVLVAGAAVAGAVWASTAYSNRVVPEETVLPHPLHGAVGKRIGLFQNLAGLNKGVRPQEGFELPEHQGNDYSAMV